MFDRAFLLEIATKIAKISEQCTDIDTKLELQETVRSILREADIKLS